MTEAVPWEAIYRTRDEPSLSWFQTAPEPSIQLITETVDPSSSSIIDIGAGTSRLADALLNRGCPDLTIVDVSTTALDVVERRVGKDDRLTPIVADVTTWNPGRTFDLWHDRAVLHFLGDTELDAYRAVTQRAVSAGGHLIIGTFAPDGPETCSGRPVTRYSAAELADLFADRFTPVSSRGHLHTTPNGSGQAFTWVTLRRRSA
jgi:predicted TPR repeat methyltransferase